MINYQLWLETPNIVRVIVVQVQALVSGVLTTRYLSTHGATIDSISYLPIIKGTISIDESISTSYEASISYGDIELINPNGEYDSWLNDIWSNKSVKVYVGPLVLGNSVIADYELIFDGLIEDIDSKSRTQLNIKIRDKLEKLNTSVSENLLGNYFHGVTLTDTQMVYEGVVVVGSNPTYQNQNRNSLKPIVFGEVYNISPLLTDPSMLEYMVSSEVVEQIIEVRDNGRPVGFITTGTPSIPAGSFRLIASPAGIITCSVQGVKHTINPGTNSTTSTYTNTASNNIMTLLTIYGKTIAYNEIDSTSFSTLGSTPIGVYLIDRTNVLQVCQDIAKSCGLVLTTTRTGVLKLVDLSIPTSATISITDNNTLLNSLSISQRVPVVSGIKLGYAKNWTVQPNLLTDIPQQHKDLYATEWLESIQLDSSVKNNYAISTDDEREDSYLISKADADIIGTKKLTLFKVRREVVSMTCTAKFLSVQVGDAVSLNLSRFNLNSGVLGRVVATRPNWLQGLIEIEVLV